MVIVVAAVNSSDVSFLTKTEIWKKMALEKHTRHCRKKFQQGGRVHRERRISVGKRSRKIRKFVKNKATCREFYVSRDNRNGSRCANIFLLRVACVFTAAVSFFFSFFLHGRTKVTLSRSFFSRKPNDNGCLDTCQPPYFFLRLCYRRWICLPPPAVPPCNYKISPKHRKSNAITNEISVPPLYRCGVLEVQFQDDLLSKKPRERRLKLDY